MISAMKRHRELDLSGSTCYENAKWIWKNLVPKSGQADYVQPEVLRAIEALRCEAQGNGNINWDERFEHYVDFIEETLVPQPCFSGETKDAIRQDLDRLRYFLPVDDLKSRAQASELPYIENDLYDRLVSHLITFCRQTPQLIPLEKEPEL